MKLRYNPQSMRQPNRLPYVYFTVFMSGMTTLAIEFGASRLLGSVFGTSNLVWASIIGLILIYLTVGYFLGGKVADKRPSYIMYFQIMALGALSAGIVPFVSTPVLRIAANAFDELSIGVLAGSFMTVLVLFIVPVTLLGMVSPFAIRLAVKSTRTAGTIAGRIYAISTLGSFIGTFLPVLFIIPYIGTRWTFILFSALLMITAIIGLLLFSEKRLAGIYTILLMFLIILGVIWGRSPIKTTAGQVYETESAYNYIQVLEQDGYRLLRLNEGQGVHSVYHPTRLAYDGPWMQVLSGPFFNRPEVYPEDVASIAIIGLAGGTIARQAQSVFGDIPIDGYEIDPKIIDVGYKYFGMDEVIGLNPIAEDGRWGLFHSSKKYSMISIDAYQPPYIPWHLTTYEYFQLVFNHLEADGVLTINVGRSPDDRSLINGLVGTVGLVFPSVYVMDIPNTFNSMIYATKSPTQKEYLFENYLALKEKGNISPLLDLAIERTITNLVEPASGQQIFTDDKAPIEWITNNMVLNYVLWGDLTEVGNLGQEEN